MIFYVTKADGTKQPFDRKKIQKTCIKLGASLSTAKKIVRYVEANAYDGIPTSKILKLIYEELAKYKPEIKRFLDLREALSLLPPKPGFEIFVQRIFQAMGYETFHGRIIQGRCSEHEIDVIATKNNLNVLVEAKHHQAFHSLVGMDVFLQVNSTLQDLREGYYKGKNKIYFDKAIVVSNSKISAHGIKYATCRGIQFIGWNSPKQKGIETLIETHKIKPVTMLKGLSEKEIIKLTEVGIVTIKDLLSTNIEHLKKITKRSEKSLAIMLKHAKKLVESS